MNTDRDEKKTIAGELRALAWWNSSRLLLFPSRLCGCMTRRLAVLSLALWVAGLVTAAPLWRVVTSSGASSGAALLRNESFEEGRGTNREAWRTWGEGYTVDSVGGRSGGSAIVCAGTGGKHECGAAQTIILNRSNAAPLIVRGWSKAEQVSGSPDSGYSIYVDLVYMDGTPQWGEHGSFRCRTHDWERREFVIVPARPVRSVTVYCLFRGHAGKAWFDDISVHEVGAGNDAFLFQGVPVQPQSAVEALPGSVVRTGDGLSISALDETVRRVELPGGQSLDGVGGFVARDVAASSDFIGFTQHVCAPLALKLKAEWVPHSNHIGVRGLVTDTSGRDRAVTLVFALPLDATGWNWGDDIRRSRKIDGRGEFVNQVSVRAGSTGTESLYPLAAVWNEREGVALAMNMAQPAVYRVGYHAGLKQLFVAFDFGLARDTEQFPSGAPFDFVIYRFEPQHGFRSAWRKLMQIFPGQFIVRSKEQGTWMPFTDISKVPGWQDFGFRYHEGNNNVPWDDEHNVLSFRYTEPMTWWMRMSNALPRTVENAVAIRDGLASQKGTTGRMAAVSRLAAMHDADGLPAMQFQDTPWCNGAVWSLNPNPWLGGTGAANAATIYWDTQTKEKLYGAGARGHPDGEYLDSLEGYVTADLNYRREHFRTTSVPLTFSADTTQVALFKGLAVFEFTRWLADDVHSMGKLMFANGVPYRFTYLAPLLDVLGTETDWLRGGKYHPASISQMDLWRTFAAGKPYLLLMNTDYDTFTPALVEKYFERCLFYGMWPGFFSHNAADNPYWQNAKWYERDRSLFQKYIPLVKRVAEAGWDPVPASHTSNTNILVERFGSEASGTVFITAFNDTASSQECVVTLEAPLAGRRITVIHGNATNAGPSTVIVRLDPQRAIVVRLDNDLTAR